MLSVGVRVGGGGGGGWGGKAGSLFLVFGVVWCCSDMTGCRRCISVCWGWARGPSLSLLALSEVKPSCRADLWVRCNSRHFLLSQCSAGAAAAACHSAGGGVTRGSTACVTVAQRECGGARPGAGVSSTWHGGKHHTGHLLYPESSETQQRALSQGNSVHRLSSQSCSIIPQAPSVSLAPLPAI